MLRNIVRDLTIALFLFTATGCLISSSNSVKESGKPVSGSTLRQVELGETTEGWLIAAIGEPTSRKAVADQTNVQILGYEHEVVKSSSGAVLFVFAGASRKETSQRTYFEITDGIVTKYWTEG
jgi:hypothetical protein